MTKTQHTPGPWSQDNGHIWHGDIHIAALTQNWSDGGTQKLANARLIAAAPDLLAALQAICDGVNWAHADCREVARAAIKQATGE